MSEVTRILDQLRRAWDGDAWHGPPLWRLLEGVPAAVAYARPVAGAHTIAEIVLHLTYWKIALRRRLAGERVLPSEAEQWPEAARAEESAWSDTLTALKAGHLALLEAVQDLRDDHLKTPVAGKDYDFYVLLHGAIQHDLYHAGQIALLKKAAQT